MKSQCYKNILRMQNDLSLITSKQPRIPRNLPKQKGVATVSPIDRHATVSKCDLGNNKQIFFRELKTAAVDPNFEAKPVKSPIISQKVRLPSKEVLNRQYSSDSGSSSSQNC